MVPARRRHSGADDDPRGAVVKRLKYKATLAPRPADVFRGGILTWYRQYGRDLPWRRTSDPYHILVSEIMLHQTTVKTVEPVYKAFLSRFPRIEDVAAAPLEAVKEITDPLGYKVRGQWLHDIAQAVVARYQGKFPATLEELLALPGIGRYTAGAILSFAFGQDAPILDTNVKRVLGRFFDIDYKKAGAETEHRLWALAEAVLPPGQGPVFNQALMDLGALICTARRPLCLTCPVAAACARLHAQEAHQAAEEPAPYCLDVREEALKTSNATPAASAGAQKLAQVRQRGKRRLASGLDQPVVVMETEERDVAGVGSNGEDR